MSLFIVRHGKTLWTEQRRFSGWGDAPLSARGLAEAAAAAKALQGSGIVFDMCFTSQLVRATQTAEIICEAISIPAEKIQFDWRLNERHYGTLQNELRSDMFETYSVSNVTTWRKKYRAVPPLLTKDDSRWLEQVGRFRDVPVDQLPAGERMFQASERSLMCWNDYIEPALKARKKVLIIAHTNSIRTIAGQIEGFNEAQLERFRISTCVPRHYELDNALRPIKIHDLTRNPKVILRHWIRRRRLKKLKTD